MNKHFLFQPGLGFTQGGLTLNVPFSPPSLFLSQLYEKKKLLQQSRAGFSVHFQTLKHAAKISHTYQIIERLCYTDFIGAYIKLIANFTTTTETLGSH